MATQTQDFQDFSILENFDLGNTTPNFKKTF